MHELILAVAPRKANTSEPAFASRYSPTGDAAHAMSPIGGVGINLAVQDAIAAANILTEPFLRGSIWRDVLQKVQERRMFPTRATQRMQTLAQNRIVAPLLRRKAKIQKLTFALKVLRAIPRLRRIPARLIGMGFRSEHVKTLRFTRG